MGERLRPARIAVYAGTFDPVHYGHIDVAVRAARLFDELLVAVVDRTSKSLLFSLEERIELFRRSVAAVGNIRVEGYRGLTVEYARQCGAAALVRGLRTSPDFEYEHQLTTMNRHLRPEVETVFLLTAREHTHLSSSLIKEVASLGANLDGLVPPLIARALREKFGVAEPAEDGTPRPAVAAYG